MLFLNIMNKGDNTMSETTRQELIRQLAISIYNLEHYLINLGQIFNFPADKPAKYITDASNALIKLNKLCEPIIESTVTPVTQETQIKIEDPDRPEIADETIT